MVNILVVDDDKNTRLFLKAVLEAAGYTVSVAEKDLDAVNYGGSADGIVVFKQIAVALDSDKSDAGIKVHKPRHILASVA